MTALVFSVVFDFLSLNLPHFQILAVGIGGLIEILLELPVEIGLAGEACHIGDVLQSDGIVFHKFCRIF